MHEVLLAHRVHVKVLLHQLVIGLLRHQIGLLAAGYLVANQKRLLVAVHIADFELTIRSDHHHLRLRLAQKHVFVQSVEVVRINGDILSRDSGLQL